MVAKNDVFVISWKDDLFAFLANNFEIERFLGVVKLNRSIFDFEAEVALRVDGEDSRLRHFEPFVVWIEYFEGEVLIRVSLEHKCQFFDDWAFGLDVIVIFTCVGKVEDNSGVVLRNSCDLVLWVCEGQSSEANENHEDEGISHDDFVL